MSTLSPGRRLGPYEILVLLGSGGQGEVYRARDHKLDRDVAVKVLPESFATPEFLARFESEAKAVAALSHPNIVAIHDFGKESDIAYAVMELLEGETLRARLARGPLAPRKAVELALQCSGALAAAHDKGIVHRDLKPENIFLTRDGETKILDFGLAKKASPLSPEGGSEDSLTRERNTPPGTILGTLGYMAPEQVRGQESDARSDLFALGAVLYEALSGERAFQGNSPADTLSAILKDDPPEISPRKAEVPPVLERIVRRCLEKDPGERFQTARDLRFALEAISDVTKVPRAEAGLENALSIAVLPFTDMSPKKDQEYFCDGMAEEILNALSKVRGLKVAARSSAFQFAAKAHNVRQVGDALGVGQVLEGSVRTAGTKLRVTAQLVSVADGYQLWSDRYDGEIEDVFAIQDEISTKIVAALRERLGAPGQVGTTGMGKRATENVQAYQLYLRGRHAFERRYRGGPHKALPFFEQAVKEDPSYVLAHAGIGDCYTILGLFNYIAPDEARKKAGEAVRRGLTIDDGVAEAHTTLARFRFLFDLAWDDAEREFKRALELNPADIQAHCWYAMLLACLRRDQEAIGQMKKAQELDPLSPYVSAVLTLVFVYVNRIESAVREGERCLELEPDFVLGSCFLAGALSRVQPGRSIELLERVAELTGRASFYLGLLGSGYGVAGREDEARNLLAELHERASSAYVAPILSAFIHAGLGESDLALDYLHEARAGGAPLGNLMSLWVWDRVRSDPRFVSVMKSMGLPVH
jgi:serine/threonine-protein kinase